MRALADLLAPAQSAIGHVFQEIVLLAKQLALPLATRVVSQSLFQSLLLLQRLDLLKLGLFAPSLDSNDPNGVSA